MNSPSWMQRIERLLRDEDGPTTVEYAVLLALIVVVCIGSVTNLATKTGDSFTTSANSIATAL